MERLSTFLADMASAPKEEREQITHIRIEGEPGWNPRTDAPAVALYGATFIESGRYQGRYNFGGLIVDAWLNLVDLDVCATCGGAEWVHMENPNPRAPRWEKVRVPCPTCSRIEEPVGAQRRL